MRLQVVALVLVLGWAAPAAAQLSSVDLVPSSGDGKITYDAATGLYWLDLTETLNLSVPDVLGGSGNWIANGWRYATPAEICALFGAYAFPVSNCGGGAGNSLPGDQLAALQGFLGITFDNGINRATNGFFDDGGDPTRVGVARLNYQIVAPDRSDVVVQSNATTAAQIASYGNWLVRTTVIPVPVLPYEAP